MLQPYDTMTNTNTAVIPAAGGQLAIKRAIGEQANRAAAMNAFEKYKDLKAENTVKRQLDDLNCFAEFLRGLTETLARELELEDLDAWQDITGQDLHSKPTAWQGITHGLVEGFIDWMGSQGYAVGTINIRLSTVKRYAGLAFKAGALDRTDYALIKMVSGYSNQEAQRVNKKRLENEEPTRIGDKKAAAVSITPKHARALKKHDLTTPQGCRDAVIMCILIDHGLRVGELVGLTVGNVDFEAGALVFYRPKVDVVQTHKLSPDTLAALVAWRDSGDMPLMDDAPLLRSSRKGGHLTDAGMTERAIAKRVRAIGKTAGIEGLSPHDCRHFWATNFVRESLRRYGTVDVFRLQEAGGWKSLAMPRRYVEWGKIANENWEYGDTQITDGEADSE